MRKLPTFALIINLKNLKRMKNVPKIEGSLSTRYTLALFVGFHRTIYKNVFEGLGEDYRNNLHLPLDWISNYGFSISSITSLNRESRATIETFSVNEIDAERNRLLSIIFFLVSNGLRSTKENIKSAAQQLELELRPYKGIQNVSDDAKTTLVEGLLEDLNKEENTEATTLLGMTATMAELEETNNDFHSAKTRRVNATNARLQNTISTQEATDEETKAFPIQTINDINVIVNRFKTSYKQSEARKDKDDEEGKTEKPSTSKEGEGGTSSEPATPTEEETTKS